MSFCGATIRPGFELVADLTKLESKIANADLVITGEGCLDRQTLSGKAPFGIAKLARKHGKRVISMVGRANQDKEALDLFDHTIGILGVLVLHWYAYFITGVCGIAI